MKKSQKVSEKKKETVSKFENPAQVYWVKIVETDKTMCRSKKLSTPT